MGHGASSFFVGGVICHVNSVSLCTEKKKREKNKKKKKKKNEKKKEKEREKDKETR